ARSKKPSNTVGGASLNKAGSANKGLDAKLDERRCHMKALIWVVALTLAMPLMRLGYAAEEGKATSHEISGTIQTINNENNTFTLYKLAEAPAATEKAIEFAVNEKTSIMQGREPKTLKDLKVGQEVKVTYEKPTLGFIGKFTALIVEY